MSTQIIQSIATIIISFTGIAFTVIITPILKQKLTNEQLSEIYKWVEIAVKAAEQLCKSGIITPESRKVYAMSVIHANVDTSSISDSQIDNLIESAVLSLPKSNIEKK